MIIFSNHELTRIIIDDFKDKQEITLVCDKSATELARFAESQKVNIMDWQDYKQKPFWDDEWGVVFSFSHLIPEKIIKLFESKLVNIHPSLLPQYRGASPLQSAILSQDKIGYSIISIHKKMDAGDILFQKEFPASKDESFEQILEKIIVDASSNLEKAFAANPASQDHSKATYCQKISADMLEITRQDTPETALSKVNCYFPKEKAYLMIEGKKFIIWQAKLFDGSLVVSMIQPEGKRSMTGKDFKNGYAKLLTKMPSFVKIS